MINRELYIDELWRFKDKQFIKVITGMQRVGKSTLIDLYIQKLIETGVSKDQILTIIQNMYYRWIQSTSQKDGIIHKNMIDFLLE